MLTLKKPSIVDKSEQAIIEQIKKITNRMKRPSPTVLMLPGGDVFELRNCALERFAKGADFRLDDWHMLGGSLVHRRDTDFNLVLSGFENLQGVFRLQAGQKLFHISSGCNSRNPKAGESSWYLQMFEGSSTKVKTFATRQLYSNLHEDIGGLGWVIRYDVWKLSVESHQVWFDLGLSFRNQPLTLH